jgi:hypothetical protein
MRATTIRALTMRAATTASRRRLQTACSAVTLASCGVICAVSAGPVRQIAGLSLVGAFACAVWFIRRERFAAIVPALGLTLACLILAGLALAAVHALDTVPVALALGIAALAATWISTSHPAPGLKPPNPLALTGVLIFASAAILAVRYCADSATADADGASSVAIWAYPSGDQLHVGVEQPAGHGAASLRIVVTQAGVTVAVWNDVRLAPGQTWQAPTLTVTGNGPAKVTALHGATVVASLSSR